MKQNKSVLIMFLSLILLFFFLSGELFAYKKSDLKKLRGTKKCIKCDLSGANLQYTNLNGANLSETNLNKANLNKANLNKANLNKANLNKANLRRALLTSADLRSANLNKAKLTGADLTGAILSGAILKDSILSWAKLVDADLTGADLRGANLTGTNLKNANLTEIIIDKKAISTNEFVEKLVGVKPVVVVEKPSLGKVETGVGKRKVEKQWTKQLGTSSSDSGNGVTTDSSGNIYVTGSTKGGLDGNTNSGETDIFLVKYNSSGTKQWTKQLGTSSEDDGNGVITDSSGNIYVTGSTKGGLDGNTNSGEWDIFLVKYNSFGTKQWTKQLGTSSEDDGNGVTTDSSGNIYVTGDTKGGLDGNTNSGETDIFLVKYNSSGTKQWTKQLGTSEPDIGYDVTTDSSGNIYVTGFTDGGLDGNTNSGEWDIFLVKYNSFGTKQWTKQLGTSSIDSGSGVITDSSGNIYVTGSTKGGLDGNTNSGETDIFLVKYNSFGTKQWTKQLGTSSEDEGYGVVTDSSGNIYVTGSTKGGLDGNTNSGEWDIFLVKYNSFGTKQWTKQLGTSSYDEGYGVTTDSSGNIYVTGSTDGGLDGNTNSGSYDIFLVKYNSSGIRQ